MKKLLLLGATVLTGVSAAFAQSATEPGPVYTGAPCIKSEAELVDGGYYFLNAHRPANGSTPLSYGLIIGQNNTTGNLFAQYGINQNQTIAETGTNNMNLIWRVNLTEDGFTLYNVGASMYLSVQGHVPDGNNLSRNNIYPSVSEGNPYPIAKHRLVDIPGEAQKTEQVRFYVQITNGLFPGSTADNPIHPYWWSNGNQATSQTLGYWKGIGDGTAQVEFIPAELHTTAPIAITIDFPDINGTAVDQMSTYGFEGEDVSTVIHNRITELGGMREGYTITGNNSSEGHTVSLNNTRFTVSGTWINEFVADNVYRLCVNPSDHPAAMRYMLSTEKIKTQLDIRESLTRLIPERFWFFKHVGEADARTYTMHTLYAPEKGVHFDKNADGGVANGATASLTDSPEDFTVFEFVPKPGSSLGDFFLKVAGSANSYVNDYEEQGYLSIYNTANYATDAGCLIRPYPLIDDDWDILANYATADELNAAKVNPTYGAVENMIAQFNEQNINAALRRVGYLIAEKHIELGHKNPGQFDNEAGNFVELYQKAQELAANENADAEELVQAVKDIDLENLSPTPVASGVFYRIKNKHSGLYISSISSHTINNRAYMDLVEAELAIRSNTVFYVDEENGQQRLIAFDNGLVMPSFNSASGKNWIPVLKTDADAAQGTKFTYQEDGCFLLHVSGTGDSHRHLYGGGDTQNNSKIVDCAGDLATDKYQWLFETVDELPITLYNIVNIEGYPDNDGWSSVYSPVALEIPADVHLTAYVGNYDGNTNTIEPIKVENNTIIPPYTTVLLYYDGSGNPLGSAMTNRQHISYINLPIVYDYDGDDAVEQSEEVKAGIYAVAKDSDKKYYTLHESHSNNFREYPGSYVPGFKAYLAEPVSTAAEFYPVAASKSKLSPTADDGFSVAVVESASVEGQYDVTIVLPYPDCELRYHHYPTKKNAARRAVDHGEYVDVADKSEDGYSHTFSVPAGIALYYGYHPATSTKGIERGVTIKSDGNVTGINEVETGNDDNEICYDLQGRRLLAPVKGINIVNNKKMFVK